MARCALEMGLLAEVPAAPSAAPCTDLGDHDGVNPHLLEAPGVVEHVGPAQGQGEHHGCHIELLATEVEHHRAQQEQGVDKAGRQERCECRGLSWPQVLGAEQHKGRERALERQSSLSNGRISTQIMHKSHLEMYS